MAQRAQVGEVVTSRTKRPLSVDVIDVGGSLGATRVLACRGELELPCSGACPSCVVPSCVCCGSGHRVSGAASATGHERCAAWPSSPCAWSGRLAWHRSALLRLRHGDAVRFARVRGGWRVDAGRLGWPEHPQHDAGEQEDDDRDAHDHPRLVGLAHVARLGVSSASRPGHEHAEQDDDEQEKRDPLEGFGAHGMTSFCSGSSGGLPSVPLTKVRLRGRHTALAAPPV